MTLILKPCILYLHLLSGAGCVCLSSISRGRSLLPYGCLTQLYIYVEKGVK